MYAVTGVTGQVGGATARHLLAVGKRVRAVLRDPGKAAFWSDAGCEVALADMLDTQALTTAFSGVDGVFVVIPPLFDPSEGFPEIRALLSSVAEAVEQTRPPRVVCLSTVGAQVRRPNLLSQLGLMEQRLSMLSAPVAFLRAAWFMENFAQDIPVARDEGVFRSFLQPLDHAIPMVATNDIGVAAAALLQESWTETRVIELQGPSRISARDVGEALSRALGRTVRTEIALRDGWEGAFRAAGMRNPDPRMQMLDGFNEGWIEFAGDGEQFVGSTTLDEVLERLVQAAR